MYIKEIKQNYDSTQSNCLKIISLEKFKTIMNNTESVYIYVGRDSCPTCTLIYLALCSIVQDQKLNLFYYSTEPDRDIRPDILREFLDSIGIDNVPAVVHIENSTIINVYNGEDFVKMYSVNY